MKKILIVLFGVLVFQEVFGLMVGRMKNAMLAILTHKSAMLTA